jgi:hypothetical protein
MQAMDMVTEEFRRLQLSLHLTSKDDIFVWNGVWTS